MRPRPSSPRAQATLDAKVAEIRQREELDPRTRDILLAQQQQVENRRLNVEKLEIEAQRDRAKEQAVLDREQGIQGIHGRIKALAILLPPLPALLLGAFIFAQRSRRENRGASPNRLA